VGVRSSEWRFESGHAPNIAVRLSANQFPPGYGFVDGKVVERNSGEFDHAAVEAFVTSWFFQHRREWDLLPETRLRVSEGRVRIADVCLVARNQPVEQVLTQPPLVVTEIFQCISRYNEHLGDYPQLKIANIWVIDPSTRVGYDSSILAWIPVEDFPHRRHLHHFAVERAVARTRCQSLITNRSDEPRQHLSRLPQQHFVKERAVRRLLWSYVDRLRAISAKLAAGSTTPDVPTVNNTVAPAS